MNGGIVFVFMLLAFIITSAIWAASRPQKRITYQSAEPIVRTLKNPQPRTTEEVLYSKLLSMNLGDRATVERLIEYERKRFPTASRLELLQRTVDRQVGDMAR